MTVSRRQVLVFLKLVVSTLLLAYVYRLAGGEQTLVAVKHADISLFLAACACVFIALLFNALRWAFISRSLGHEIPAKTAITGTIEATFFNQILPAGIGGDAMRVVRACDAGTMTGWAIIGVTVDRAIGLMAVASSMVAVRVAYPAFNYENHAFSVLFIVAFVVFACGLGGILLGLIRSWKFVPGWASGLIDLVRAYSKVMRSFRFLSGIAMYLLLSTIANTAAFILCARSVGVITGWLELFVIIQAIALVALVPLSIGGWGVREGAAVLLFAPLGVDASSAAATSVLFGLVLTVIGILGAAVWFVTGYRRLDTR